MSYSFDPSSDPPSDSVRTPQKGGKGFAFGASEPSTTPAGPPPSSAGSFTPAEPPPSLIFGSSVFGPTGKNKAFPFSTQNPFEQSTTAPRSALRHEYQSSPPIVRDYKINFTRGIGAGDHEKEVEEDEDSEGYAEDDIHDMTATSEEDIMIDEQEAQYEVDDDLEDLSDLPPELQTKISVSQDSMANSLLESSLLDSKGALVLRDSIAQSSLTQSKGSTFGKIAKDLYCQIGLPSLEESDDFILKTESFLERLYAEGVGAVDSEDRLAEALTLASSELMKLWSAYDESTRRLQSEEYAATIGPGPQSSDFGKANFIAQLALRIYQPGTIDDGLFKHAPRPLTSTLLEWLDAYHDPLPKDLYEILGEPLSPSRNPLFWNIVLHALLRGNVRAVISILKKCDWRYTFDQSGVTGYSGVILANVEKVVGSAVQVLETCPASYDDWNIENSDWTLFREMARKALDELRSFAEGRYRGVNVGREFSRPSDTFSQTAKKAESRVPWYLYQNLLALYCLILGDATAAIANAQDWCESTVGLLLWRNEDNQRDVFASSRRKSVLLPLEETTWKGKLRKCFEKATSDPKDQQVNSLDPVEVALASLFEGNNEAVIGFLRAWSSPISAAVAEIAACGLWSPQVEPQNLIDMTSFDQNDLDVLGISASENKGDSVKDETLIIYAQNLARRSFITASASANHDTSRHGWEIAVANLGRLDSAERSEQMVAEFLRTIPVTGSSTVDKLWKLLNHLGMTKHAQKTAETYADKLAEETHEYGQAVWYYSLSHNAQKVKDVLDLLISLSLTQSTAYPPEAELDAHLERLIKSPATSLADLSSLDIDAAKLVHNSLSGYATLRHFYCLRDAELRTTRGERTHPSAAIRKQGAAIALLAVITSSDDNIRGGLYDESRGAIVSVDFLLALLGEVTVFLNDPDFMLSILQIELLLRAIEDLQGVASRIYSACDEFLQTVLASTSGLKGATPADMLRKSTSNLSGSSFTLTGSSMMASRLQKSISGSGSGKVDVKRAWDWRKSMSATTSGEELIRRLRIGLAGALADAWLKEADGLIAS